MSSMKISLYQISFKSHIVKGRCWAMGGWGIRKNKATPGNTTKQSSHSQFTSYSPLVKLGVFFKLKKYHTVLVAFHK